MKHASIVVAAFTFIASLSARPASTQQESPSRGVAILSETHGYDFEAYIDKAASTIVKEWFRLIPQEARLQNVTGSLAVGVSIRRDGEVDAWLAESSGATSLDEAAIAAPGIPS